MLSNAKFVRQVWAELRERWRIRESMRTRYPSLNIRGKYFRLTDGYKQKQVKRILHYSWHKKPTRFRDQFKRVRDIPMNELLARLRWKCTNTIGPLKGTISITPHHATYGDNDKNNNNNFICTLASTFSDELIIKYKNKESTGCPI